MIGTYMGKFIARVSAEDKLSQMLHQSIAAMIWKKWCQWNSCRETLISMVGSNQIKFESGMKIMEIVNEGRSAGGRHTGIKLIMTSWKRQGSGRMVPSLGVYRSETTFSLRSISFGWMVCFLCLYSKISVVRTPPNRLRITLGIRELAEYSWFWVPSVCLLLFDRLSTELQHTLSYWNLAMHLWCLFQWFSVRFSAARSQKYWMKPS